VCVLVMGAADDGEYTVTTLATLSVNAFQCTVAFGLTVLRSSLRWLLHTVLAWSLPNGHAGRQMLFL
jgi:hypothetical protein